MKHYNACPDYSFRRITDITVQDLRDMGAEAVAIDLDNTTVKDSSYSLPESTKKWLDNIKENGISVVIISNTTFIRAWYLSKKMGSLPFFSLAAKPHTRALRKASEKLGVNLENIAMIGDRLFTDVMAANKAGAISVRVEPMEKEKRFKAHFERARKREEEYMRAHGVKKPKKETCAV